MKLPDIQVIRDSIGKIVSMLTQQKIRVTQRGAKAYVAYHPTTGAISAVNIPYLPDDATPEFVAAVQGFLDHEVGHVLHSDPKIIIAANKLGKKIANLHNAVEDVYVERKMTEGFSGSTATLGAVREFFLTKVTGPKIAEALAAGDKETAVGYALMPAFRAWGGQLVMEDFIRQPHIAELVAPLAKRLGDDLMRRLRTTRNSRECLELAQDIHKALLPPPPPPAPPVTPPPPPPPSPAPEDDDNDEEQDDAPPPVMPIPGDSDDEPPEENDDTPPPPAGTPAAADDDTDDEDDTDADPAPVDPDPAATDPTPTPSGDDDTGDTDDEEGEQPDPVEDEGEGDGSGSGGSAEDQDDDDPKDDGSAADFGNEQEEEQPAEVDPSGGGAGPGGSDEDAAPLAVDPDADQDLTDHFEQPQDFDEQASEALSKEGQKQFASSDYAIYSTEWDRIEPGKLSENPATDIAALEKGTEGTLGVMQKQLERALAAQARKAWNPGQRRGRIAPGSLFKTAVGEDRIFRQRFEVRAKNTAVTLLGDCSGSMRFGPRLQTAMRTLYALSSVLERLKITHEVAGFTTYSSAEMARVMKQDGAQVETYGEHNTIQDDRYSRTEPIYMPIFKGFDQRLDSEAKSRMGHMMGDGARLCRSNVDGESVQIAGHRLLQQTAERHILMVLSDGDPNAMPGGAAVESMRSHLKKVVKDLRGRGVEVIGIGIQTDSVAAYYDKFVVLDDLDKLATTVMGELTKILLAP